MLADMPFHFPRSTVQPRAAASVMEARLAAPWCPASRLRIRPRPVEKSNRRREKLSSAAAQSQSELDCLPCFRVLHSTRENRLDRGSEKSAVRRHDWPAPVDG